MKSLKEFTRVDLFLSIDGVELFVVSAEIQAC